MAGLCSSAFIIFYLMLTSFKERKVTPCNCILIALSISNFSFTVFVCVFSLGIFVWPWLFDISNVYYVLIPLTCSICSSTWLTSILCFFYFIKILQFKPGFFAWVKMRIDTMVPWLIITVLFVSTFAGYLLVLIFDLELPKNSTNLIGGHTLNDHQSYMKSIIIITSTAYMVSLPSTFASAWFLKQQRSVGKYGSTKVKDYQSAVNIMISLVSFYTLIYVIDALDMLQIFAFKSWGYWMCLIFKFSFTAVQSALIIRGNPKLREAWKRFFGLRYLLNHQDG
ncbi:taste receptor type 2 member 119-like [Lithobates pipiens]